MKLPDLIIVVAMTRKRVIGCEGRLPWHIPDDLRLFRELTTGKTVIMGRKTFASLGRPLKNRRNLVVSRTLPATPGVEICPSLAEALQRAAVDGKKVFVIGGGEIYRQVLPIADGMVVSWIREDYPGDTFFPEFDPENWSVEKAEEYPAFCRVWYKKKNLSSDGQNGG